MKVNKLHVVAGIILNAEQEILIAQRPHNKFKAGLWEFPGGKIEPYESDLNALKRELLEEIGINVLSAEHWIDIQHNYGDKVVFLTMWFVTQFSGEPHGKEGQEIAWVSKNALNQFEFLEGNREIIDKLQRKDNE